MNDRELLELAAKAAGLLLRLEGAWNERRARIRASRGGWNADGVHSPRLDDAPHRDGERPRPTRYV